MAAARSRSTAGLLRQLCTAPPRRGQSARSAELQRERLAELMRQGAAPAGVKMQERGHPTASAEDDLSRLGQGHSNFGTAEKAGLGLAVVLVAGCGYAAIRREQTRTAEAHEERVRGIASALGVSVNNTPAPSTDLSQVEADLAAAAAMEKRSRS